MKTKLIILAVLIIVLGGGWYYYKNNPSIPSDWLTYSDEKYGFEFKFPPNLCLFVPSYLSHGESGSFPTGCEISDFAPSFFVGVYDGPVQMYNEKDEGLERKEIYKDGQSLFFASRYSIVKNRMLYYLGLDLEGETLEEAKQDTERIEIFDKIISTFKFTK